MSSARRIALALLVLPGLASCAQFPDLDDALSPGAERAAYPDLLPVEQINAQLGAPRLDSEAPDAVAARVAALRARAARLRGTVIDSSTKARMYSGVQES